MHGSGLLVAIGITLLIEIFMVWKINRALSRGTIRFDPFMILTSTLGFDLTASRATSPILYWIGVLLAIGFAVVVLAIFILIAVLSR